ncbi:glycosyltransferase family 1 protein [bacterium]|nr:glycosyltransferase family 1 protein [bacterium]
MRLLYLTDITPDMPAVDYLPDELYHGLVSVLGRENVIDYPPKPTYHLPARTGKICNYAFPNLHAEFDPFANPESFDVIVVSTPRPTALKNWIALRNLGKPIVAVDGQDDAGITAALLHDALLYFKREVANPMPEIIQRKYAPAGRMDVIEEYFLDMDPDYFKNRSVRRDIEEKMRPISFSVEPELLDVREEKTSDLFFAGGRTHRHRRAALDHLLRMNRAGFDVVDGHVGNRETYLKRLASARIGLSIRGSGFDCVRYWEIPAVGTLLLSERPGIAIHCDFTAPAQAIYFDRLDQIEPLVTGLLEQPERLEQITRAGREHVRAYHTTPRRAEYFLNEIDAALKVHKEAR